MYVSFCIFKLNTSQLTICIIYHFYGNIFSNGKDVDHAKYSRLFIILKNEFTPVRYFSEESLVAVVLVKSLVLGSC